MVVRLFAAFAIMALDLSLSLFTSAGILLSLAVLVTILRCITRIYVVKAFGIDDYFMIAAVVSSSFSSSIRSCQLNVSDSLCALLRLGFLWTKLGSGQRHDRNTNRTHLVGFDGILLC